MPLEHALDQLREDLLADQLSHGPRVHRSELYCFACTMEHIDAIFQGTPELAGLKAVAAMQRLSGHPGVARHAGYAHLDQCHAHHVGTDARGAGHRRSNTTSPEWSRTCQARGAFRQQEETKQHPMTNKQQEATADQLYFDGSSEPNPGGRMGAGWRLVFTDRPQVSGSAEWPAAQEHTNNRAEYLARSGTLEHYLASGRSGLRAAAGR
jgi:hypothetical protein